MSRLAWMMVALVSVLLCGCPQQNGGSGTAARVNFTAVAKLPSARTITAAQQSVLDNGVERTLPRRPTTGRRKDAPPAPAVTEEAFPNPPCEIGQFACAFDGPSQDGCESCKSEPPDPNAAAGAGKIVVVVNDLMQVTDRAGGIQCGGAVTLQTLLNTTDSLTDPRVQFDDVNQRFTFSITVSKPASTDAPAIFVAATETDDPCGTWTVYRITFHGSAYPAGDVLDFPMLGQDQNALLLSVRTCLPNFDCGSAIFTVFALPKTVIYSSQDVAFNSFLVDSLTAPVTNAGNPMIPSPVSFFLSAVPGTGYKLYRLTNSGGAGAVLTKTTINAPFSAPSRPVNEPGAPKTINSSDGNIVSFPYFDGTRIWFSHDGDDDGFPTVRYGFVDTSKNTVETTWAFHSGTSDDFNSSLAVGFTPRGEIVFLNWAFTDSPAGKPTTAVYASGDANKPLVTIAGAGTPYTTGGGVTGEMRFGDFSSVSVDPTVSGCAVAAQQYFATDGQWKTRIEPIGQCRSIVVEGSL